MCKYAIGMCIPVYSLLSDNNIASTSLTSDLKNIIVLYTFFQATGLYEYKVIGYLDCDTEVCQKVYMDLEYRKIWDSYVKGD